MTQTIDKLGLVTPANPADGLVSSGDWRLLERLYVLSERESSVAQRLFAGQCREQIAFDLLKEDGSALSPETVRVYVDRLFRKLNVTTTAQMVLRIVRVLWLTKTDRLGPPQT